MSVSMVALSSGRMSTTAVDGSVAAKVRNRLAATEPSTCVGGVWEEGGAGRGLGTGRSPLPRIKIFLLLYNDLVVKVMCQLYCVICFADHRILLTVP